MAKGRKGRLRWQRVKAGEEEAEGGALQKWGLKKARPGRDYSAGKGSEEGLRWQRVKAPAEEAEEARLKVWE